MFDHYKMGLAIAPSMNRTRAIGVSVGGFDLWKGIRTPGQIRDEIERINADMKAMGDDLANAHIADPNNASIVNFMDSAWTPFVTAWSKFFAGHDSWLSNVWGSTWDQAQIYQKQLLSIRQNARAIGVHLNSADPILAPDSGPLADFLHFLKNVIYVVLSLAGGYLIVKAIMATRATPASVSRMKMIV